MYFREFLCIEYASFLLLATHTDKWPAVLISSSHTAEKRILLILPLESSVDNWNCSSWCCSWQLLLPQVSSSASFILWQGFHLVFTVQSSILRSLCGADRLGTLLTKHITPGDICRSKSITNGNNCTPCYSQAFFSWGDLCTLCFIELAVQYPGLFLSLFLLSTTSGSTLFCTSACNFKSFSNLLPVRFLWRIWLWCYWVFTILCILYKPWKLL